MATFPEEGSGIRDCPFFVEGFVLRFGADEGCSSSEKDNNYAVKNIQVWDF
jgi:hypothetical protein